MSTAAGHLATESQPEGAVRRASGSVKDAVGATRVLNSRLEAIKARIQGIHAEVAVENDAPEPVRNDLEELDHQISILHGELNVLSNHLDDVNSI